MIVLFGQFFAKIGRLFTSEHLVTLLRRFQSLNFVLKRILEITNKLARLLGALELYSLRRKPVPMCKS